MTRRPAGRRGKLAHRPAQRYETVVVIGGYVMVPIGPAANRHASATFLPLTVAVA